jgi:type II secretory pathway component PulF
MENMNTKDIYEEKIILFKSISAKDKSDFFEYLAIMLYGKISIIKSLESVKSKITNVYFKSIIDELIIYISSGDTFSKSIKNLSDVFTMTEISMIEN